MNRDIATRMARAAALLLCACIALIRVDAQIGDVSKPGFGTPVKPPPPMPKPGPTPRTRAGRPDLSGVWFVGLNGTYDLTAQGDPSYRRFDPKQPLQPPSFQPWVALKWKRIGPREQAQPDLTCMPHGVPGFILKNPYPIQIIQTDTQLIMLAELDNTYRTIWIDGRPQAKDPDPKFNGNAVGRWEGDVLVVDVVGIDTHIWVNGAGLFSNISWFPSDVMRLTERMWRPDSNTWLYQVTVDDPKVLTKPWTSPVNRYSLGQVPMSEYYCSNNLDASIVNPPGVKPPYISEAGLDERFFDEDEYQELLKEAAALKR